MHINSKLELIKGVGEKTAEQLALAGFHTVGDLISFYPRSYEDFSKTQSISEIVPGKVTIKARCESISTKFVRRGMRVTTAVLADDTGKVQAVWFNQPYRETQLKGTGEHYFSGVFELSRQRYSLVNPAVEKEKQLQVQTDRILPVYRSVAGTKPALLRKLLDELRPLISMLPETLPDVIVRQEGLLSYSQAIMAIHFPESMADIERAKERLGFEELFQVMLASQRNRSDNAQLVSVPVPFKQDKVQHFVAALPFSLTNGQRRAAWDIIQDLEREVPMNRMLQGDVGSGKTVVAGLVARLVAEAGYQTAVMAPTELLARQHASTLATLLEPLGVTVGLLTSSVKGAPRKALLAAIQDGRVAIVVGTHALIQSTVEFHALGLVVIDEQHRFGVAQRQALLQKAAHMPHLLAMTATPIPRSLALTVYGDLDISILNERPANRLPIETSLWSPNSRAQLYALVDAQLSQGRQAYVICPRVAASDDDEAKSVEDEFKRLRQSVFRHRRIGMLHGKMAAEEKASVMQDFLDAKIDILVSTTVVEVGVDVPNATVMIIENADSFGLAQLHQLRGRVGRSEHQSYCYLLLSDSKAPSARLKEIERSQDGFYLAEVDLKLRGPGEIYGRMQHGALNLKIATLGDTQLIARAQAQAEAFIRSGQNLLHYKQLHDAVMQYQKLTTLN